MRATPIPICNHVEFCRHTRDNAAAHAKYFAPRYAWLPLPYSSGTGSVVGLAARNVNRGAPWRTRRYAICMSDFVSRPPMRKGGEN